MKENLITIPEQNINIEQRENIKKLEQLRIGPSQKASIILVLMELKPATELYLYEWNDEKEKVEKTIQDAGLEIKPKNIHPDQKNVIAQFAIARDKTTADQLLSLDPRKDHKEYGRVMGYPKTAINAHFEGETLSRENYPEMKDIIFNMKLSKEHWQKELEILKNWSNAIKEYAPNLYKQLKGAD